MKTFSTAVPEVVVLDMFCGAGGITTGLTQACEELGIRPKVIAINHWNVGIETTSVITRRQRTGVSVSILWTREDSHETAVSIF
jgi:site-specific DNA-cytosine methylase